MLHSREAACVHEQVAQRNENIRFTGFPQVSQEEWLKWISFSLWAILLVDCSGKFGAGRMD
jgi:hypothetical protein